MREIVLSKGKVAFVDDIDYPRLMKYKWYLSGYYAACRLPKSIFDNKIVSMHRFIMNVTDTIVEVDHINHNKLDNRKCNLRIATKSQNQANARIQSNNTSGFKGVYWHKKDKRWMVMCKGKYIGSFVDINMAALAYNKRALEIYGNYAFVNELI